MMESTAEHTKATDTPHVRGSTWPVELHAASSARRSANQPRATSPNQVLAIVSVGMILANLDLFVVNVGLPNIALDFGNPSLESLSWILNGYTITYAALLVFFGRLSERYPRNVSFLVGIAAFTAASVACAAATGAEMLVIFRVVQAAAAALTTPTSLGLLLSAFPLSAGAAPCGHGRLSAVSRRRSGRLSAEFWSRRAGAGSSSSISRSG